MFVLVHELGELCHFSMIFVMVMSEPRFIWLVDASVAVFGCGSTDRVSDLEMEVHRFVSLARFSLDLSHFR